MVSLERNWFFFLTVSMLGGCGGIEGTACFYSFYCLEGVVVLKDD